MYAPDNMSDAGLKDFEHIVPPSRGEDDQAREFVQGVESNLILPEQFRQEAAQVAQWVKVLETGVDIKSIDQPIRTFVGQLAHTGFIVGAPSQTLPSWLHREALMAAGLRDYNTFVRSDSDQVQKLYPLWTVQTGYLPDKPDSPYFLHPNGRPDLTPQAYKIYLERENLLRALTGDNPLNFPLNKAFQDLGNLAPRQFKYKSEAARLVLYFFSDIKDSDSVIEAFRRYGLVARGPAQDVNLLVAETDGGFKLKGHYSNDEAWGDPMKRNIQAFSYEKSFQWYDDSMFQEMFLRWYLNRCLEYGKSPVQPYRTSFVRVGFPVDSFVRPEQFSSGKDVEDQLSLASDFISHRYPVVPVQLFSDTGLTLSPSFCAVA